MTLIPTIYNADTLGIRPDLVGRPITHWKDLLDPAFKGKASILNIPSIGIMDAAMVMESMGEIKYADKGNMTKAEIDKTIAFLIEAKKAGQFRAFWKTFDESVNLMAVRRSDHPVDVVARRRRRARARASPASTSLSRKATAPGAAVSASPSTVSGLELDAAYEYINWYLSGWVGAYLNRQGYYSAVLDTAKQHMSAGGMGLLDGGQAGRPRHPQPRGQGDGEGRRRARRRLVLRPHGQGRLLERGDGRGPLHGPQVERVHRGMTARTTTIVTERREGTPSRRFNWSRVTDALAPYLQVAPLTLTFAVFLLVPIVTIVVVSFWDYDSIRVIPDFILLNYEELLTSSVTWRIYLNTLKYAALTWALTLGIGFTVAYFVAFHVKSLTWQITLFMICTIPFWTSNIIRMISWIPFLGRNGILNSTLISMGVIDQPLEFLLFSDFSVVLAFVHLYVLFMVVPIFNSMMRIDRSLIEAAVDAGAAAGRS